MEIDENIKTILERMDNVELELLKTDIDYAKDFLEEEGFNIDQELSFSSKNISKVQFMAKAIKNKQRDHKLLEMAYKKLKKAICIDAKKATDTLITLLQSKRPALQYRKLDNWSDEEIKEVLADLDLIELLEKLEEEE